jgi:hypothetical protein
MRKLMNGKIAEQGWICPICHEGFTNYRAISCLTTGNRKEWAELGEMIIRTISKQPTGGVTEKKDQPEWMTDGPSVG